MSSGTGRNILKWNRRSDDDADNLSEQLNCNLPLSEAGINSSPLTLGRGGSTHSSNHCTAYADNVVDDEAASEIGSNSPSHRGHTRRESISSSEGSQAYSKRAYRPRRLREPAYRGEKGGPGFPHWRNGYSGDSSSSHGMPSEWTHSESASPPHVAWASQQKSPMGANLPELDSEYSMRMEELRDQRIANQFQSRDEMRSVRNNPERYGRQILNKHHHEVQSPHCCLHCRDEVCGAFRNFSHNCCIDGSCRICSHTCCYPSAASATHCHATANNLARHQGPSSDKTMDMFSVRDRNQPRKRPEWPIFGGTRYIMCYKCEIMIQIPEDFQFLRVKCNRMKCGSCENVISYSVVNKTRIVCSSSSSEFSGPTSGGNDTGICTSARSPYSGSSPRPQSEAGAYDEDYSSTEYETDAGGYRNLVKRLEVQMHPIPSHRRDYRFWRLKTSFEEKLLQL